MKSAAREEVCVCGLFTRRCILLPGRAPGVERVGGWWLVGLPLLPPAADPCGGSSFDAGFLA